MSVKLEVVGYIKFVCSPCDTDNRCTFGCGKRPKSLCEECYNGHGITGWLPIVGVEDDPDCLCDDCGNLF